ncbi:RagB/SusD family nutrient uptake outer membrane protein [Anseongella ginsenosidimutans]|nr:RagB/SusD family nutrient uptake outer membrane protein [Anseongella ginsenosidimutans]QEC51610.1 RagB/SusD family nutrient uptake outer membrane protein [Anseongella ginsenosidimutans]
MKKILMAGTGLALLLTACNPDLLDTAPDNKYVESSFWQTEQAANAALTGCYGILSWDGVYGNEATPLWEETATPNAHNDTDAKGFASIAMGLQSSSTGGVITNRWARCYGGIGRCNTFLARVDEVEGLDEDLKARMKAEAKFLRGLYYFMLQTYYGDVPLILDPPDKSQSLLPRDSREKVIAQVLKDLDEAAAALPLEYGSADQGRATKGAAMALKARVLLYEASPLFNEENDTEKWKAAADAAKAVMDMAGEAGYGLFPDYRSLFLPENENNEEVIFDVQYIYPDGGNSFDLIGRQYNTNAPLQGLVDAYYMKDGLPANKSPLTPISDRYENLDPRFYATVVFPGDTFMGEEVEGDRFAITGYGLEKYTIYTEAPSPDDKKDLKGGQSETNYMVLRYADILLMYAEAMNEYSGPGPLVYEAVNAVRARAGMPPFPAGLSQAEMRNEIRHERRIEFAGEGYYYNDIRRWKTAEVVMNGPVYTWENKEIEVRIFDPARDYWWPIPQTELDLNQNLTQNPGY